MVSNGKFTINKRIYFLQNNIHIVAIGKAGVEMVKGAEAILEKHVVGGIASIPWNIE